MVVLSFKVIGVRYLSCKSDELLTLNTNTGRLFLLAHIIRIGFAFMVSTRFFFSYSDNAKEKKLLNGKYGLKKVN